MSATVLSTRVSIAQPCETCSSTRITSERGKTFLTIILSTNCLAAVSCR